jgi:hypothetical protein
MSEPCATFAFKVGLRLFSISSRIHSILSVVEVRAHNQPIVLLEKVDWISDKRYSFTFSTFFSPQRGKLWDSKGFGSFRAMPKLTDRHSYLWKHMVVEIDTCEN